MKILSERVLSIFFCGLLLIFLTSAASGQTMFRKQNDFDGDGKADFAVTRNIGGYKYWYIWQSTNGSGVVQWGLDTDEAAAGDFDGDGKFDHGVYRNTFFAPGSRNYQFWMLGSQTGPSATQLLTNNYLNTVAHQQDYDGDGKTDPAHTFDSGARTVFMVTFSGSFPNGLSSPGGALIKVGDLTGDGKADVAGFNSSTGVVSIRNSADNTVRTINFGRAGDEFMPADFDGDGKGDLTVFRQSDGSWWWLRSSDNVVNAATFGASGDVPVPADYDGDGKTDIAIYRPGTQSYFWVYGSQSGIFALPWGVSGDTVVRY